MRNTHNKLELGILRMRTKHPVFVPEPFPEGEELGGDDETDKRRKTEPRQAADDSVIDDQVKQADGCKLADDYMRSMGATLFAEDYEILDGKITCPAQTIAHDLGGQPRPVSCAIQQRKGKITNDKERPTTRIEKHELHDTLAAQPAWLVCHHRQSLHE